MTHPTDDELQDFAHSVYEEALSFGLSVDTFLRYFKGIRNRLAQPPVAPPAPGGDVLERRSETGMPMSANAPEKCPITRRPFFMVISHPELGWVPTYGGPYDSYTIPHMEGKPDEPYHERELTCHHYDHDYGGWVDDESIPMRVINEGVLNALQSTQAPTAAAQGQDAAPAEQTPAIDVWVESAAKGIYDCWTYKTGWVPWVPYGNSLAQDEARRLAAHAARAARAWE